MSKQNFRYTRNVRLRAATLSFAASLGLAALSAFHPAPARAASMQPLILLPVPEAPHGVPRSHVAARLRHSVEMASIQSATSAALAALPLHDTSGLSDKLKQRVEEIATENAKDQDIAEAKHFFAARDFVPAWTDRGQLTARAKKVLARMEKAKFDGLDPADFALEGERDGNVQLGSVEELVELEVQMTAAVARYISHAAMGRINPRSVSNYITIDPQRPDITGGLTRVAASNDPASVLEEFHPTHDGFIALRESLARIYESEDAVQKVVEIPSGPLIKPGQTDKRIPLLRTRLGVARPGDVDDLRYDAVLEKAVVKLQKKSGLPSEGFIGNLTLGVLNGHALGSRADVIINMERWRWLPRDLGKHHVFVNLPEYLARVVTDGKIIHTTRVVIGKTKNQTPIFSDEIEHIVVNPTWSVPRSIATKEYLPQLQQDPTYLQRRNIQVLGRGGQVIDPTTVDWESYSRRSMPYRFKQPSGRGNALGNVKFMFPNEHSVYLHDTQSRSLFSRTTRAYSHGCVRVHQPFEFAEALLENEAYSGAGIRRMVGGGERHVILKAHVPVHLTYFTAIASREGSVRKLGDVYGHDARMKRMLGL
ncbi:murein L,D-transpeptidase [Tepidamorphus sp. 3E244]|uniref:L,D-transpeptidase family protein n=1 Tax=Tepidamorphus sp. 3E244 TaxID=3385498 RepID=UPI0038FC2046